MPSVSYGSSRQTRLLYQDLESERTYEVERANIRTTSNPFPDGIDDFGFAQYHPFNYSIRGDLCIALPVDPQICADIAPRRRGLFASVSPTGKRTIVPVVIQEVQCLLFTRVEFSFVAIGPLTECQDNGISLAQADLEAIRHHWTNPPANPDVVWGHSAVLAQRDAPIEPPKPHRPARRRRLLVPVDISIEA